MTPLRPSVRVAGGATYILIQGIVSTLLVVVFLLSLIQVVGTFAFKSASARFLASCVSFGMGVYALKRTLNVTFDWEVLWKVLLACILMAVTVFLVTTLEGFISALYLFPVYVIVGAIAYFLSLIALKAIKKQDLDLIHDYLPEGFKRIVVWVGRLASVK